MKLLILLVAFWASNAFAEELTGLGILKIGSSKEQIQALMKKNKVEIWATDVPDMSYEGWDLAAYENVPITPKIKLAQVMMYFHKNKLYFIEAGDDNKGFKGNDLLAGFVYKYGEPVKTTEVEVVFNPCGGDGEAKVQKDYYAFNEKNNISAGYFDINYYDLKTNEPITLCSDGTWANSFWLMNVTDNATQKIANELQAIQDNEDKEEKFEGL